MTDIHDGFRRQGLVRPRDGRVLAGVCAGLGRRFGLEAWMARLLFVLVLLVIPGSQLLIYPVLWLLMPNEETDSAPDLADASHRDLGARPPLRRRHPLKRQLNATLASLHRAIPRA